jgi:hypothetical protein
MECLREIKDIRDELTMIDRVLEDQIKVISSFESNLGKRVSQGVPSKQEPEEKTQTQHPILQTGIFTPQNALVARWNNLLERMKFRQDRVKKLFDTNSPPQVNQLLDLKQKQGNLNEARDTSTLAKAAEDRAQAGETQNQLLWVFTIVTVFFVHFSQHTVYPNSFADKMQTPLSFISGLFAIPSQQYPYNGSVDWKLWHIAVGMCTFQSHFHHKSVNVILILF